MELSILQCEIVAGWSLVTVFVCVCMYVLALWCVCEVCGVFIDFKWILWSSAKIIEGLGTYTVEEFAEEVG